MSRHSHSTIDQAGGRYEEHAMRTTAALEHPVDWCAMVFKLARRRALPDLRGGRQ
jgi:hypothetical protein